MLLICEYGQKHIVTTCRTNCTTILHQLSKDNKHTSILEIILARPAIVPDIFTVNAYLYFSSVGPPPHTHTSISCKAAFLM